MTAVQLSNRMHVAICLRELRTRLGVTQKALAMDMRTTPKIVSRWETGKEPLSTEQTKDLCMALKCTTDQLFGHKKRTGHELNNYSPNCGENIRYGTFKIKTTVGTRKYPINECARSLILGQLKLLYNSRSRNKNRNWIHFLTLNNKIVAVNPNYIQSVELIGDDVVAMPQYYRPELYRAFDDWETTKVPEKVKTECEIIIAEIGEEEAMRMVSYVRVTYKNGQDEWNFLDDGSAATFFELEAAAFNVFPCTFAEVEEEGYYRARYANLDHVAVMEVPRDRYHKLTRNRPTARRGRTTPLSDSSS
jgi:transcriptional regulator with XRE-family HTH domain